MDLIGAVAGVEEVGRAADVVGVSGRDLALVGGPYDSIRRVVDLRDVVIGNGADDVVFAGPQHRQPGPATLDLRVVAGGDQADVALVVGVYEIVGRRVPAPQRVSERLVVARLVYAEQHIEVLRRDVARPPPRGRLAALGDHGSVDAQLHGQVFCRATEHGDVVAGRRVWVPSAIPVVLAGVC